MKKYIVFLLLAGLLFSACNSSQKRSPEVKDGFLDLSKWDFKEDGNVSLDGTWEFYWNKLYAPENFKTDSLILKATFLKVPEVWNSLTIDSKKLPGYGYATYRLRVKLDHEYEMLGIKLTDFSSSYKLWINNRFVASNGTVSDDLSEVRPQLLPQIRMFIINSDSLEVVVQVANNFHYKGGMWESVQIGTPENIISLREEKIFISLFFAGTLFILFIYHLWIFILRRTEKAALWFGILCLAGFFRTLQINERIFFNLFPDFSLNFGYRFEYFIIFSCLFFFGLYFFYLFKNPFSRIILKFIAVISIIEAIIIFFTPTIFYTSLVVYFQGIIYAEFIYFFISTFSQIAKRKEGAVLLLISWIAVLVSAANDVLYLNLVINTGIISHYVFFIFLLAQAYILSKKIANAFSTVEDLSINLEHKVAERTRELGEEKRKSDELLKKSDELLLNILPAETANELKHFGRSSAKTYGLVTVMFTDFKDFTDVSEKVSPELLVSEIDTCFSAFDNIIQKYGIEKIKTVGDSYICAGGLPVLTYTHAVDTLLAANEILEFIMKRKKEKEARGEIPFQIRIGIHTGPVVAGIVGVKKFSYDIWGDTVNIAARMESSGEAGKINISGSTYQLVKDKFKCTYRGKIEAKHKGEIDMYFVEL